MTASRQISLDVHPSALRSVTEQADYYARRADSALARRWELAVDEIVYSLLKFPLQGSPCRSDALQAHNLRSVAVPGFTKYLVLYKFSEEENTLTVVLVTHGARDYAPLLAAVLSD